MKYKDKILEIISDKNPNALPEWLTTQPLTEHVVIIKEFRQMALQNMFKSQDFRAADTLKEFTKAIDTYEKAVLIEIEAEKKYKNALLEQEKQMQQMEETVAGVREYIINCIINKEENAEAMQEFAQKIMASEKEMGIFDSNNWQALL